MKKHLTIPANNKVTFKVSIFTSSKAILQRILPLQILLLFRTSLKWHLGHKLVRVNKIASQTVQQRTAVNTRSGTVIRDLTKLRRWRHRKRQKSHRLNGKFFCRSCTTTLWNGQTVSLLEKGNGRGGKFYRICLNSGLFPSLQLQHKFPSF